jgi:uncharacterized membrane protein
MDLSDVDTWLHLLHILGAMAWVGGGLMLTIVGLRAKSSGDLAVIRNFNGTLSYSGRVLFPSVIVVAVTGVWMVFTEWNGDFSQLWILLALAGFVLSFLIGALFLSRAAIGLGRVANQPDAPVTAAADAVQRWINGYLVVLAILLITVWDMVFKPGL